MTLLQMSAMGSVLILLIIFLRKLLGNWLSPGCYLALWLLAGVRLLLPVSVSSPFSVYQFLHPDKSAAMPPVSNPVISSVLYEVEPFVQPIASDAVLASISAALWVCGALACFSVITIRHWRSRAVYRASLPVEEENICAWMQIHKLHRSYQIRQCQQIATPLSYGVICPVILLPAWWDLSDEEEEMVLLHEWNHIRHFDALWQWLLVLLCSIHWFNPLVWLMAILCRQDMELFCDRATVRGFASDRRSVYARLLLRQAAPCAQAPLFSQFCFSGYHRMEERIQLIMQYKSFHRKAVAATAGLLCVGILCFATTAAGETASDIEAYNTHGAVAVQSQEIPFVWPVLSDDAEVTLTYGVRTHPITGETMQIDHICIGGVEKGTAVAAAADGVVKEAGFDANKGNYLILQCGNDMELHYRHCETLLAAEGDTVAAGEQIATLGQTGAVTGPCLSFAVYLAGEAVDPMLYL